MMNRIKQLITSASVEILATLFLAAVSIIASNQKVTIAGSNSSIQSDQDKCIESTQKISKDADEHIHLAQYAISVYQGIHRR